MNGGPAGADGTPAHRVFICYRREESAAHAGRLYDAMVDRFGEGNVFMDVDLAPGVDFVARIGEVVAACRVLIVVMGPRWATVEDENGEVRIADPDDFVRLEVQTGLSRPEVTPIPVLISGARMPRREDLPPEVAAIARRNALELSDGRWRYDVGRLNSTLDELLSEEDESTGLAADPLPTPTSTPVPPTTGGQPPAPAPTSSSWRLVLEGMLVAGLTALLARWLGGETPGGDDATEVVGVIVRRTETWAAVGAALAVWLASRATRAGLLRVGLSGLAIGALAGVLSGAIRTLPIYLPADNLSLQWANRIDIVAVAVVGAFLGALLGGLWRPPRRGPGLAAGAAAAAVFQVVLNGTKWDNSSRLEVALTFALLAIAIAGAALATLVALDRRRSGAVPAAGGSAGEP